MRPVVVTLVAVLAVAVAAAAQPPVQPAAPPPPAPDPKLDAHLTGWERQMKAVVNFKAAFTVTKTEAVFKKERKYTGQVQCLKPNLAWLRMDSTTNKDDYEAFICTGKSLFLYSGLDKTVTEAKLNPGQGAADGDNVVLKFLSGMTAQEARGRFAMKLFGEDATYVYLDVQPVLGKDKLEFLHARFALFAPAVAAQGFTPYLPAQVYLAKPNGDSELWAFSKHETNVKGIGPEHFQYVEVKGYTRKEAPPQGPPAPPPGGGLVQPQRPAGKP